MIKIKDFLYNSKVSYAVVLIIMFVMMIVLSLALESISEENKPGEAIIVMTTLVVMTICYILCKYLVHASCYMDKKRGEENRNRWKEEGII